MSITVVQYIVKMNIKLAALSFRKLTYKFLLILKLKLKIFICAYNLIMNNIQLGVIFLNPVFKSEKFQL